jgi:hypothetical protein
MVPKLCIRYKNQSFWVEAELQVWVFEPTLTTYVRLSNGGLLAIYGGDKFAQYNIKNMIMACWQSGPNEFYLDSFRFKIALKV